LLEWPPLKAQKARGNTNSNRAKAVRPRAMTGSGNIRENQRNKSLIETRTSQRL
jgi:hypothetical protein